MGNLVLSNPSEPYETQQAIVTAIHEDEAVLAAQGEAIAALEAAAIDPLGLIVSTEQMQQAPAVDPGPRMARLAREYALISLERRRGIRRLELESALEPGTRLLVWLCFGASLPLGIMPRSGRAVYRSARLGEAQPTPELFNFWPAPVCCSRRSATIPSGSRSSPKIPQINPPPRTRPARRSAMMVPCWGSSWF